MKRYTKQQAFDKVAEHLLTQNEKSVLESGCAYRGYNGKMCAIGVLIPDELYSEAMEEKGPKLLVRKFPEIGNLFLFDGYISLLEDLLHIHDDSDPVNWKEELTDLGMRKNLVINF